MSRIETSSTTARGSSIGVTGLCLVWGLITQALTWAGILSWSWVPIWAPFLIMLSITLVVFIVCLIIVAIAALLK